MSKIFVIEILILSDFCLFKKKSKNHQRKLKLDARNNKKTYWKWLLGTSGSALQQDGHIETGSSMSVIKISP